MHVLIQADMEGVSQITRFEDILPVWPAFWERGRDLLTADIVAAVNGLRDGGATEITVFEGHGRGARNIIEDRLPDVRVVGFSEHDTLTRQHAFDATFQLGRHARRGTNDAFVPHTFIPRLAVAIDGQPITESHYYALRSGVPLLGMTGDDKLANQLDGALACTPYLVVKHSLSRTTARATHASTDASAAAIRAFAAACVVAATDRPVPTQPRTFMFAASLPASIADHAAGQCGLLRESPTTVSLLAEAWWRDVEPALLAIVGAAFPHFEGRYPEADPDLQATLATLDPIVIDEQRRFFLDWIGTDEPTWG